MPATNVVLVQPRTQAHFTALVMTFYVSEISMGTRLVLVLNLVIQ